MTFEILGPEHFGERRNQSIAAAAHQAAGPHAGYPASRELIGRPSQGKARATAGVAPGTAATEHRATGVGPPVQSTSVEATARVSSLQLATPVLDARAPGAGAFSAA